MSRQDTGSLETENDARMAMLSAESSRDYEAAAIAAIRYAEFVGVRSAEGALVLTQRAQVYAALHQADTAVWVAENRRERMP